MHGLHWPDAVLTYVVLGLVAGFPVTAALAWAYDFNAGRVERTAPAQGPPGLRGLRLGAVLVGIGLLAAAPGLAWFLLKGSPPSVGEDGAKQEATTPSQQRPLPSIAVLPLVNLSSDKEQEYFSDGLSEELLNLLAQLPQLRVIARTSSFSFKGKNVDVATIAKALDVANILEGSVRKSGSRLRVTAQLIRAADSSHLWSQTYDRELTDVFAVQDDIAGAVVAALKLKLLPGQSVPLAHRTGNTEAYEGFLLGQQLMRGGDYRELGKAVTALEKAVALDPKFAAGFALLSLARLALGDFSADLPTRVSLRETSMASADMALALDPGLAEAYLARAWVRCNVAREWASGEADLERARVLDPNNAALFFDAGEVPCFRPSRLQERLTYDRKVLASDPQSVAAWHYYGLHLFNLPDGRPQAEAALRRALELSPTAGWPHFLLAFLDLRDGRAEPALAQFRLAGPGLSETGVAMAEHTLGHAQASQQALAELQSKYGAGFALQVAQVHAWRGERDLAFEWLDRAAAQLDSGLVRLRYELPLAGLRADPRFAALVARLGLPE